jgi:hypothetical protein
MQLSVFLLLSAFTLAAQTRPHPSLDRSLLDRGIAAMGGLEKLEAIERTAWESRGHTNLLEQSERPEGPWIVQYLKRTEHRDFQKKLVSRTDANEATPGNPPFQMSWLYQDGVAVIARAGVPYPQFALEAEEALELGPERLLLTARSAADLKAEADVTLQAVPHHVVSFRWKGSVPVRLYLNAETGLPTQVELRRAYPHLPFWGVWGDFVSRYTYSFWHLEKGGVRLPRQVDLERNGQPYQSFLATKVELGPKPVEEQIPEKARAAYPAAAARTLQETTWQGRTAEVGAGVLQLLNGWNTAFIQQPDGVVILEAPYATGYSKLMIEEAGKRFPGVPVKAVISTSDAWPHFGGLREYAARGIPMYIVDRNVPIVTRLLHATFTTQPDAWEKKRGSAKPAIRPVSAKTVIGTGETRVEIYPIRSESGERMMMVYFPALKTLYASDLVQGNAQRGFFMPQYLTEVRDAVEREKLVVERVFAMHAPPMPWSDIEQAVRKAVE